MPILRLSPSALALAAAALAPKPAPAQQIYLEEGETERRPSRFVVPYAFPSDTLDVAFGAGGVLSGFPQPQATLAAAAMGSSNGSYGGYFVGNRIQVPFADWFFFDPWFFASELEEMRRYEDGRPGFGGEIAGSNDSDEDDFLEGKGTDLYFQMKSSWVLPIGDARQGPVHTYRMRDGLLADNPSGGHAFNPWTSGRTLLSVTPFFREKRYDDGTASSLPSSSNGLAFTLEWDNRDFVASPERGEHLAFTLNRDFGWFDSDNPWTTWEASASKYISFGDSDWARQRVLALGFWTADTPTWEESAGGVTGAAPDFRSPRLGGFNRMRAYPFDRFNDRAAIYYTAEFRYIPRWNPWAEIGWLDRWLEIDWWQLVPFVEVGRVAPEWDLGTLHEDMKWDAGLGFRFMAKRTVVRVDIAASDEGPGVWAMLSHPF